MSQTEPDLMPRQNPNPKDVDFLIAKELNQMSFKERELVYEELHGVDKIIEETPEFLEQHLEVMELELCNIPRKPAYDEALRISGCYVTDRKFRLMFLRSEYFDAQKAAIRLVKYLQGKVEYFGPGVLVRPLYLTDLDENDQKTLRSGYLQILPARDRAGRVVLGNFKKLTTKCYKNSENLIKTLIYLILAAAEDEETQIRGMVAIGYFMGKTATEFNPSLIAQLPRILEWVPLRISGLHVCFDDPRLGLFKSLLTLSIGQARRARLRIHHGLDTECRYHLMTFGLPVEFFPLTVDAELKNSIHLKWIQRRHIKDETLKRFESFDKIDLPGTMDVIVARGKPFRDHAGNVRMRYLINLYLDGYDHATKQEKTKIAWKVVHETKAHCGRFLERNTDGWFVEVMDDVAREKVSVCFRSVRRSTLSKESEVPATSAVTRDRKRPRIENTRNGGCPSFSF